MVRRWTELGSAERISEWRRVSRPSRDDLREERAPFRERLTASLRAGHGLGVAFDLRVRSGPAPELTLGCSDPSSARWVSRILLPVYGRHAWVRGPPSREPTASGRRWGRRVRPWPEALRQSSDGLSALDSLALALSGAPPGICVAWRSLPCPASWGRPLSGGVGDGSRPYAGTREVAERGFPARRGTPPPPAGPPPGVPLFWNAAVSLAFSPESSRAEGNANDRACATVEAALRSGRANGVRFSRWHVRPPWGPPALTLSEEELACVLPGLDGEVAVPCDGGEAGLPMLPIGRSVSGRIIGPPMDPGQGRHIAVLGETGMGKSSALLAMAREATTFGGVLLFDPLGETADSFVVGLSDRERMRLVEVSPRRPESGINALEGIGGASTDPVLSDRRLNDLVHALRRVRSGRYADSSYWGPRLEEMLTRALRAAGALPSGTLADAHALLVSDGRSRGLVPPEARDAVGELRDRIRDRPEDAEGARRLLYEVVRSPVLLRMLCDRNSVRHPRELVEPGRIAVISGEAALVGESVARYLLSVYLALVWSELLARPSSPKTFVVLDESQWFSHESLAEMLRLARRKNVHVLLATQTIASLPDTVAESVWTNVADFVAFRGSPDEARELSRATAGVSMEEILALPRGHAAVLLGKGNRVEWVRTVGRPPVAERPPTTVCIPRAESPRSRPPEPVLPSSGPPTAERVFDWIRARARTVPVGETLRVELDELRKAVDPAGQAVREAGSRLGRAGALLARSETERGPAWVVDPARIPAGAEEGAPSVPGGGSSGPQQPS